MWKWCLSSDFSDSQLLPKSFGGRLMWQRPTNDGSGLHVYGGDEGRKYYIRKNELWEMDERFYQRKHYSNLNQLCNHLHCYSRNNKLKLLGSLSRIELLAQVHICFTYSFFKSSSIAVTLIKAQFFYPPSTNLLYWAYWAWIHLSLRNSA